ncbi:MAG TPA: class I SAM-dependent methyltransferase [Bacteroidales bacterium]|nr:class I SAM-dependent methyltransferase [Bacteroidales bacterium]
MTPEEINRIIEIPSWDTHSAIKSEEAKFIYDFISANKLKITLEIGFAFAMSASHIIAATNSKHIVCDPFQSAYMDIGIKNIERLNFSDKLDYYADYSHNLLPSLLNAKERFEFIFIDGDHKFDGIMVDFYYSDLLLADNGYIMFHDTWMRSTRLVESFIRKNRNDYRLVKVPHRNLLLFRKTGIDSRDAMFFKEFYNFKSILKHSLIRWRSNGKKNMIEKLLIKIRNTVK